MALSSSLMLLKRRSAPGLRRSDTSVSRPRTCSGSSSASGAEEEAAGEGGCVLARAAAAPGEAEGEAGGLPTEERQEAADDGEAGWLTLPPQATAVGAVGEASGLGAAAASDGRRMARDERRGPCREALEAVGAGWLGTPTRLDAPAGCDTADTGEAGWLPAEAAAGGALAAAGLAAASAPERRGTCAVLRRAAASAPRQCRCFRSRSLLWSRGPKCAPGGELIERAAGVTKPHTACPRAAAAALRAGAAV